MNKWFAEIIAQGTGRQFELSHNEDWLRHTRPILEAVFHAHYFLKMACKYGRELEVPRSSVDRPPVGFVLQMAWVPSQRRAGRNP